MLTIFNKSKLNTFDTQIAAFHEIDAQIGY